MATKDISDVDVCLAVQVARASQTCWPYDLLAAWTGEPLKVCYAAMERAERRGLVEYGVSLRTGWLSDAGERLLNGGG